MTLVLALIVFVPMLVEARRSVRNERVQRARGGLEADGDVYDLMRAAYPGSFAVMLLEGAWRGATPMPILAGGLVVFTMAKLLKWWAILALGRAWTFRVIVVPGDRLVVSGPYRFLRHPNYIGVVVEFIGVLLMTGALVTGPVLTGAFLVLIVRRTVAEERSLGRLDPSRRTRSSLADSRDDELGAPAAEAEGRQAHS